MEKKITSNVTKGLIISLILVVVDLIGGFANLRLETWFRWIPSLILAGAIIWACTNYGAQNNGLVTFGNVFAHGFKTCAVVACIMVLYTILSVFVIFPEARDMYLETIRKKMEENQNNTSEMIDQAMEVTKRLFIPIAIAGAVLGTLLIGVLASLIGAAVTKKNPPSVFETQP